MVRAAGVSGPSQAVPWLGRGAQLQTQNKPERDHVPRTEKAKAEHKGVGFLLFFFSLVEYNVMNSARGPAPPFNILSAEQGFLWQPGEPGEP